MNNSQSLKKIPIIFYFFSNIEIFTDNQDKETLIKILRQKDFKIIDKYLDVKKSSIKDNEINKFLNKIIPLLLKVINEYEAYELNGYLIKEKYLMEWDKKVSDNITPHNRKFIIKSIKNHDKNKKLDEFLSINIFPHTHHENHIIKDDNNKINSYINFQLQQDKNQYYFDVNYDNYPSDNKDFIMESIKNIPKYIKFCQYTQDNKIIFKSHIGHIINIIIYQTINNLLNSEIIINYCHKLLSNVIINKNFIINYDEYQGKIILYLTHHNPSYQIIIIIDENNLISIIVQIYSKFDTFSSSKMDKKSYVYYIFPFINNKDKYNLRNN